MGLEHDIKEMDGMEKIINQDTELGQVMKNLDSDRIDKDTMMSDIDFNAKLTIEESSAVLVFDELQRMGILPKDLGLTRQKKRISRSLEGWGSEQKVRIVQGDREAKSGHGFMDGISNLFKRNE